MIILQLTKHECTASHQINTQTEEIMMWVDSNVKLFGVNKLF